MSHNLTNLYNGLQLPID